MEEEEEVRSVVGSLLEVLDPTSFAHVFIEPFVVGHINVLSQKKGISLYH